MTRLHWTRDGSVVMATSAMHDDGDHFLYEFHRTTEGWENNTPEELIIGPCKSLFPSLDEAKAWAEETESKWIRSTPTEVVEP